MTIYDFTPQFIDFFSSIRNKSDTEKLKHFWSDLHPVVSAFYDLRLENWKKRGEDVEEKLLEEFTEFEDYEDDFTKRQASASKQLEDATASFQTHFPDFSPDFEVYFLHSLKEMDGGVRKLDGQPTFIFGLDMMSRFHSWQNEMPFFHHELLHFYMKQLHAEDDWYKQGSLLYGLWEEGLATYISHLLNPGASYDELSLNIPAGMRERVWEKKDYFVNELASNLLSTNEDVWEKYFLPWPEDEIVPGRAGYFIGYMVISELAKQYGLKALVKPASADEQLERFKPQLLKISELPKSAYFPNPPELA